MVTNTVLDRIRAVVGSNGIITDESDLAPFLEDWRRIYRGATPAVVRPSSVEQVSTVVRLCAEAGVAIVPQGGNTGMCGGATPSADGQQIVLGLGAMNRVLEVDAINYTITVEAGCILANVQQAALAADRMFPLSLGAEGSCQIGGNIATNAGGVNVLRYGNTRDLTLGLQVVLPDGTVWNGLRGLRKDNTGYDLKQLFIGSEGTLGIITAAVLKLFPIPRTRRTAIVAVPSPADAVALLALLRGECGDRISAFELISRRCMELVLRHIPGTREPLEQRHAWYVLAELADANAASLLHDEVERALATAAERGMIVDAAIAANETQKQALWRLRETIPEAARAEPDVLYRHDIAVAISKVPELIATADAALARTFPDSRVICFGHIGDGNLHFNVFVPGRRDEPTAREATDVNRVVHDIVERCGGTFSAEHGIGQAKRDELVRYKSSSELALMQSVKRALDPNNLMNPGKVLSA